MVLHSHRKTERRERDSNPRSALPRIHAFQACSFSHSDISPAIKTRMFLDLGLGFFSEIDFDLPADFFSGTSPFNGERNPSIT